MLKQKHVLIASSEIRPLAQTGGLADVASSLPKALMELGVSCSLIMPAYRTALAGGGFQETGLVCSVDLAGETAEASLLSGWLAPGLPVYLVRCDPFFDRPGLYGDEQGEYEDNSVRFVFFCKAVLAFQAQLAPNPDLIVGNDWQTGLIMAYLAEAGAAAPRGVFVIHNQGYLGLAPQSDRGLIGLPEHCYGIEGLEYYGQLSFLKAGIVYSQAVVTVSPSYAREIQTPEGGHGLDGVMRHCAHKLHGILNGADYSIWNPAEDPLIPANYSLEDLSGKAECKKRLLAELGLLNLLDRPVIGMVTRLAAQKGLGLVAEGAPDIFKLGLGLVILGSGEEWHENLMRETAAAYPSEVSLTLGFNNELSHRITAGCDLILVPSIYEPCGLVQMYALRYGTVPVVRAVGGLNDTVRDYAGQNPDGRWDTGFKFTQFQTNAMVRALRRAADLYKEPKAFQAMMTAGMREDFSWNQSARSYAALFAELLTSRDAGTR